MAPPAVGSSRVELLYAPWRVSYRQCRVRVERVAWAQAGARFTDAFDELAAYLAQITDKTQVTRMLGIAWEAVGAIVARVIDR